MVSRESKLIKQELERSYDIPFEVSERVENKDSLFVVYPQNELGELFEIHLTIRQRIRLIVEIYPQKYAADMIRDINNATEAKHQMFLKYLEMFRENHAKVDIQVNKMSREILDESLWDMKWNSFRFRVTKVIADDEETVNQVEVISRGAILATGMMLSLLNIERLEQDDIHFEGKMSQVTINKYERNPANRELCLAYNGFCCKICGFDFEKMYGSIGHQFIHVHHIETVASHNGEYIIDPKTEMIPVCANCHAMLHRTNPPINPDELREMLKKRYWESIDE